MAWIFHERTATAMVLQRTLLIHSVLGSACLLAIVFALGAAGCGKVEDIHDTQEIRAKACVSCHSGAYASANTTITNHSTFGQDCQGCHNTTLWSQAAGGVHPETAFPITTGSHSKGVGCSDCHNPSLGSPVKGANTDCIHCHLGAHQEPTIDMLGVHVGSQTPSGTTYPGPNAAKPNFCLDCHPTG
jgi:hypothetical protein